MTLSSTLRYGALVGLIVALPLLFCSVSRAAGCGDLDCSGTITATDALAVLRIAVGESLSSRCSASCQPDPGVSTTTTSMSPPQTAILVISEIMADPAGVADSAGEWFEIINKGSTAVDLRGIVILDDGSDFHRIDASNPVMIAPEQSFALARNADSSLNGGLRADYVYDGVTLSNSSDELILMSGAAVIDRVAYVGGFVARGRSAALDPASTDAVSNDDPSAWCEAEGSYGPADAGTPGRANPSCQGTAPTEDN